MVKSQNREEENSLGNPERPTRAVMVNVMHQLERVRRCLDIWPNTTLDVSGKVSLDETNT